MSENRYTNVLPVLRYFYGVAWKTNRPYFLLVIINMVIRGLSPFINILLPKYLIDELMSQRRSDIVIRLVGVLVLANFILYLVNNLIGYLMNRYRTKIEMKFDELLGYKAMEMDFEYTENPRSLTQLEKARTGMSWYSGGIGGLSENLTSIISGFITFLGTIYIIGSLSPWLIFILISIIIINLLIISALQKMQSQFMKDLVGINRKFGYYFSLVKDFRYGKDIRMYAAEDMVGKRVNRYIDEDWAIETKRTEVGVKFQLASIFLNSLQQGVLYGYLGFRVLSKLIGIGDLWMLLGATQSFSGSLNGLLVQCVDIAKNADFMNEYRVFMQYPSVKQTGTRRIDIGDRHVFEFKNVSFKYPEADSYALKNVSIKIPTGQKLSIVGENGAGKTTFIKLLCRLYDPTDGVITLDGIDIREYDIEDYVDLFSVIFQDYKLFAFTVGENIAAAETIDEIRLKDAVRKAGFTEKLNSLEQGINTSVYKSFDEKGVEFSGGESQKLAIARAMYKNAPVAILDEPTAALDPVAEYDIYNRFDSLLEGKTALYISHRLSSCRFCDRIAVFANGEIVELGKHSELVSHGGKYSEMWGAQAQYYESADNVREQAV